MCCSLDIIGVVPFGCEFQLPFFLILRSHVQIKTINFFFFGRIIIYKSINFPNIFTKNSQCFKYFSLENEKQWLDDIWLELWHTFLLAHWNHCRPNTSSEIQFNDRNESVTWIVTYTMTTNLWLILTTVFNLICLPISWKYLTFR